MFQIVESTEKFNQYLDAELPVLAYFSTNECNVCKVLKPKVEELFASVFPKFVLLYINLSELPEVGAQLSVFSVPTLIVYFEGKEFLRKSRNIGISELEYEINRPYSILFPEKD